MAWMTFLLPRGGGGKSKSVSNTPFVLYPFINGVDAFSSVVPFVFELAAPMIDIGLNGASTSVRKNVNFLSNMPLFSKKKPHHKYFWTYLYRQNEHFWTLRLLIHVLGVCLPSVQRNFGATFWQL